MYGCWEILEIMQEMGFVEITYETMLLAMNWPLVNPQISITFFLGRTRPMLVDTTCTCYPMFLFCMKGWIWIQHIRLRQHDLVVLVLGPSWNVMFILYLYAFLVCVDFWK